MRFQIGLDIGGTKIAGALFDHQGNEIAQQVLSTPCDYPEIVMSCKKVVEHLENNQGVRASVGASVAGVIDEKQGFVVVAANSSLHETYLGRDLTTALSRPVPIANDANCFALAEYKSGAGQGYGTVLGLIMGTGVAGGFIHDGIILSGCNGFAGEIGHLPLPFREDEDGPVVDCICKQKGCIDKSISGPALARLYTHLTGENVEVPLIAERATKGEGAAKKVLDQFYTTVAKAMISILNSFDPEIIVVGGGLINLPGFFEIVPKRLSRFSLHDRIKTRFVRAQFGSMAGLRGAAALGRSDYGIKAVR